MLPPTPGHPASFFLSPDWFALLAEHGMPATTQRIDAHPAPGLCLPLIQTGRRYQSLSNFYSPYYAPIDSPLPERTALCALGAWFRARRAQRIELFPLRADSPLPEALCEALHTAGYFCDTYHRSRNWYLPCEGLDWEQYLAARPSRLRNSLRRCQKRLAAEAGYRIDIITEPGPALEAAITRYAQVYAQSWKEPEPFPDFTPALCRTAAACGALRLGVLHLAGQPIAAQIWIVTNRTASIYKLAYDAGFARWGAGTVLSAALTRHVLDLDRVHEIDFLTGDDAYKAEWMSHCRELVGLIAFDTRSAAGWLMSCKHRARKWLARHLHQGAPAQAS